MTKIYLKFDKITQYYTYIYIYIYTLRYERTSHFPNKIQKY